MDETRTGRFNDQYDKLYDAALSLRQLNRVFTAHTAAEYEWISRRNAAMQAAWRSLFREYNER
jgi:hypothetical protein